jgi:hypothetical protein
LGGAGTAIGIGRAVGTGATVSAGTPVGAGLEVALRPCIIITACPGDAHIGAGCSRTRARIDVAVETVVPRIVPCSVSGCERLVFAHIRIRESAGRSGARACSSRIIAATGFAAARLSIVGWGRARACSSGISAATGFRAARLSIVGWDRAPACSSRIVAASGFGAARLSIVGRGNRRIKRVACFFVSRAAGVVRIGRR